MDLLPLLIIGLLAGVISGAIVGVRGAEGYLASLVVGVVGMLLAAWLSAGLGFGVPGDLVGGVVLATVGASLVRIGLQALRRR